MEAVECRREEPIEIGGSRGVGLYGNGLAPYTFDRSYCVACACFVA